MKTYNSVHTAQVMHVYETRQPAVRNGYLHGDSFIVSRRVCVHEDFGRDGAVLLTANLDCCKGITGLAAAGLQT